MLEDGLPPELISRFKILVDGHSMPPYMDTSTAPGDGDTQTNCSELQRRQGQVIQLNGSNIDETLLKSKQLPVEKKDRESADEEASQKDAIIQKERDEVTRAEFSLGTLEDRLKVTNFI